MNSGIYSVAVARFKRSLISEALRRHGGNLCHTAKALGMHRNSLWTAMRSVGIKPNNYRPNKVLRGGYVKACKPASNGTPPAKGGWVAPQSNTRENANGPNHRAGL